MTGDDYELQGIFIRMSTVEGEISAIKSTIDNVVQELKRLPLKIDNRSLTDGTY